MLDTIEERNIHRTSMRAEMLDYETEQDLARAWRDRKDEKALHRLIEAHMRLSYSIASKFRKYGFPKGDLVQEGHIGLMKAAERFDPDREIRFSTYAMWWIRASIQDYILRNYSSVRMGASTDQKTLFFKLKRVQTEIENKAFMRGITLTQAEIREQIATHVGVSLHSVEVVQGRMSGSDFSLNAVRSQDDDGSEWIDFLEDESENPEELASAQADREKAREIIMTALETLSPREIHIITERLLREEPKTLDELGRHYNLSKERIRQVESKSLGKMKDFIQEKYGHNNFF
jgi:RNA polymerase sigma-32 factor